MRELGAHRAHSERAPSARRSQRSVPRRSRLRTRAGRWALGRLTAPVIHGLAKPRPGPVGGSCPTVREELRPPAAGSFRAASRGRRRRVTEPAYLVAGPRLARLGRWDFPARAARVGWVFPGGQEPCLGRGRAVPLLTADSDPVSSTCGLKRHPLLSPKSSLRDWRGGSRTTRPPLKSLRDPEECSAAPVSRPFRARAPPYGATGFRGGGEGGLPNLFTRLT